MSSNVFFLLSDSVETLATQKDEIRLGVASYGLVRQSICTVLQNAVNLTLLRILLGQRAENRPSK